MFLLRLMLILILLPAASYAADAMPHFSMIAERRRFVNDNPTSESLSLEQIDMLRQSGWSALQRDGATGRQYIARRSTIEFRTGSDGDLILQEGFFARYENNEFPVAKNPLLIPLATNPHRAENLLVGRHPLTFVMPQFTEVLALILEGSEVEEHPSGRQRLVTNEWVYVLNQDREKGAVSDVAQYHRETGMLVKRTVYEDWYTTPSGAYIPRHVYMRTFMGDETQPIVEMRYLNIQEEHLSPAVQGPAPKPE